MNPTFSYDIIVGVPYQALNISTDILPVSRFDVLKFNQKYATTSKIESWSQVIDECS